MLSRDWQSSPGIEYSATTKYGVIFCVQLLFLSQFVHSFVFYFLCVFSFWMATTPQFVEPFGPLYQHITPFDCSAHCTSSANLTTGDTIVTDTIGTGATGTDTTTGTPRNALTSESWSRDEYYQACFFVWSVEMWFSPPVQSYLGAVLHSGYDITLRWLDQVLCSCLNVV